MVHFKGIQEGIRSLFAIKDAPMFGMKYSNTDNSLAKESGLYKSDHNLVFITLKVDNIRINQSIRAKELRVIGIDGENLGVLSTQDAQKIATEANLDLIEISPMAQPPVAKIMDYGKYQYELKKKAKEVKAKSHVTETKSVQVKIGTGDHDLNLKAKRAAEWLTEGHRVKIDLFLWGRYKYMEESFLRERLDRFLKIIPTEYKIADEIKKSPKGLSTTLERVTQKVAK